MAPTMSGSITMMDGAVHLTYTFSRPLMRWVHQAWLCPSVAALSWTSHCPRCPCSLSYTRKRLWRQGPATIGTWDSQWLVCTWEAEVQKHRPRLSPQAGAKPSPVGREPVGNEG